MYEITYDASGWWTVWDGLPATDGQPIAKFVHVADAIDYRKARLAAVTLAA